MGFILLILWLISIPVNQVEQSYQSRHISGIERYGVNVDNRRSGRDRCRVSDCLCLVSPARSSGTSTTQISGSRRHEIFFTENSSDVSRTQVQRAASRISGTRPLITLTGYTDGCGSASHNRALARRRVQAVKSILQDIVPGARISTVIAGERTPFHSSDSRKVDIVIHTNRSLTTQIERIPADVYLIDASGSMWPEWRRWTDVVNASFRSRSRVYVSVTNGCRDNQSLSALSPGGGTEIWYSYWKVLDFMSPGETLLIISDFDSRYPLTASESASIRRKVEEKQITVRTISL